MGFFDDVPVPQPPELDEEPPRPTWDKPEDALGVLAGDDFVLARTDDTAVAITGLTAFPTGFEFELTVAFREPDRNFTMHRFAFRDATQDDFLRLGLRFADGTIATNLGHNPLAFADVTDPIGPVLLERGGGGGGRRYDQKYWVWPLPPSGTVTFVCAWPARGIPESQHDVDADRIREAASRATYIWS
jgi:hypothetical protein